GKFYAFTMYPATIWDQIASGDYYEFRGTREVTLSKLTIVQSAVCGLFGIDDVDECHQFCLEFYDPVYVANTISIIVNHHNLITDEAQEPELLDYIFLPIVILGSAVPFIPVGKLTKSAGLLTKYAKKSDTMKQWFFTNKGLMHNAALRGDSTQLNHALDWLDAAADADEGSAVMLQNLKFAHDKFTDAILHPAADNPEAVRRLADWIEQTSKKLDDAGSKTSKVDAFKNSSLTEIGSSSPTSNSVGVHDISA
ncbi:unnamed protein product, partial [marine sediment metagenome]